MAVRRFVSFARIAAIISTCAVIARTASAAEVRVSGSTRVEARAERSASRSDGVVIRGTLRDDVGNGVSENHVSLSFFLPNGQGPALLLPQPLPCARSSSDSASPFHPPHVAPDEYVVDTDSAGAFCLETALPIEHAMMKLRFEGSAWLDAASAEVSIDLAQPNMGIAFDPQPRIISLDRASYPVSVRVTTTQRAPADWRVSLRDETGRPLGSAQVDAEGLAHLDVEAKDWGEPGPGLLRATLEGTSVTALTAEARIERHAQVDLELEDPVVDGVPEEGIHFTVRAKSARGTVTGSVEAVLGNRTIGAAPLHAGRAALTATFSSRIAAPTAAIRYLPDAPWWEPGIMPSITLRVRAPSPWHRAPIALLGLGIVVWMLRRSYRLEAAWLAWSERKTRSPLPPPSPALRVVRGRAPFEGWVGVVVDAHEGSPIVDAQVSIVVAAFPGASEKDRPTLQTRTDALGNFVLRPGFPVQPTSALLRVDARWHTPFERPLPLPSELEVPMVARRRRLLDQLVQWSLREWGPWKGSREPTPRQIATRGQRSAERDQVSSGGPNNRPSDVQAWAEAVETAAFGPGGVDETTEHAVVSLEPKPRA